MSAPGADADEIVERSPDGRYVRVRLPPLSPARGGPRARARSACALLSIPRWPCCSPAPGIPAHLLPPVLPRAQFRQTLGVGAFKSVYKAYDEEEAPHPPCALALTGLAAPGRDMPPWLLCGLEAGAVLSPPPHIPAVHTLCAPRASAPRIFVPTKKIQERNGRAGESKKAVQKATKSQRASRYAIAREAQHDAWPAREQAGADAARTNTRPRPTDGGPAGEHPRC